MFVLKLHDASHCVSSKERVRLKKTAFNIIKISETNFDRKYVIKVLAMTNNCRVSHKL